MVWITCFFTEGHAPKTGLSATIDIYRLSDDVQVVTGAAMSEVGGGYYKYDFSAYDDAEEYVIIADGSVVLGNMERYKFGGSAEGDIKGILDSVLRTLGLVQENHYIDQTVFSGGLLTSARIRIYTDAISVGTDSNVLATYLLTATYSLGTLSTYKVVKQ